MITFQNIGFWGQFGNQMFQYAALLGVAIKNNYEFGVPYSQRNPNNVHCDFCLADFFHLTAKNSYGITPCKHFIERGSFNFEPQLWGIEDGTDMCGFFQSEYYFFHCRERIKKEFTLYSYFREKAGNFYEDLKSRVRMPIAFLHVRRTDALSNCILWKPVVEYYKNAKNLLTGCHFLIVTDDLEWCKDNLSDTNTTFSPFTNKIDDFTLMLMADHGIISNSTFSWWGSWLGSEERKIVCPTKWFMDGEKIPLPYCKGWIGCNEFDSHPQYLLGL